MLKTSNICEMGRVINRKKFIKFEYLYEIYKKYNNFN